jgi:O-acetylserine/cysteine efflux transporter
VLAAALSWAAGNIVARKAKAASGLGLVVWSGAVVPVPLAGLSLLVDGPAAVAAALLELQPVTMFSALYTAVFGSLVGYGIWNRLLGLYPSSAVVPFTLLVPVVGMTTAWLVLGEVPSAAEVAGGLLLLAGVAIAVLRGGSPRTGRHTGAGPGSQRRVGALAAGRAGILATGLPGTLAPDEDDGRLAAGAAERAVEARGAAGLPADAGDAEGLDADARDAEGLDADARDAEGLAAAAEVRDAEAGGTAVRDPAARAVGREAGRPAG